MKKIFTITAAVIAMAATANAQNFSVRIVGSKTASPLNEKAPGDTIVAQSPAMDTCQSQNIGVVDAFGTFSVPQVLSVQAVAQKFIATPLVNVLAVGGYVQLVGTQSLAPYQVTVNGGTTTPGSALGTAAPGIVVDTLSASENIYYVIWAFSAPVTVTSDFYVAGTVTPTAAGDTIRYLVSVCGSGNTFVNNSGSWLNSSQAGITNDLTFEAIGVEGATFGIQESIISTSAIMPNPASDMSVLVYNIKESSSVNIKIVNMTGQVVKQINEGSKQAGTYTSIIDVKDLANGTYIYQITAAGASTTGRLVVAK